MGRYLSVKKCAEIGTKRVGLGSYRNTNFAENLAYDLFYF